MLVSKFAVFFSAIVIVSGSINQSFTFQLKKCCPNGTVYRHHLDICKSAPEGLMASSLLTISSPEETVNIELHSQGLEKCPSGFVGKVSFEEFLIFSNGSVLAEEEVLNENEYCIDYNYENGSIKSVFLRFCSPDPCWSEPCIKKCCPFNMMLDRDTQECKLSKESIDILEAVTDENGSLLKDAEHFNKTFTLIYGTGFKCSENMIKQTTTSWPVVNENGSYINFEALLDVDRVTEDYCIDFIDSSDTIKGYRALACMELYPPVLLDNADESIYPYFHAASILLMLATLLVYALLPELRTARGVLAVCLVSALTLRHSGTLVVSLFGKTMPDAPCIANAVVTHFAFLASSAWLNVIACDVWLAKPASRHRKQLVYYSAYGWGLPGAITIIGQILDNMKNVPDYVIRPQFGVWACWFFIQEAFTVYLYGPAALMSLISVFFFVSSSISIYQSQSASEQERRDDSKRKQRLRQTLILFALVEAPWISEIAAYYSSDDLVPGATLSNVLEASTGFVIFLLLVCRPSIFRLLRKKYFNADKLAALISQQIVWTVDEKALNSSRTSESSAQPSLAV